MAKKRSTSRDAIIPKHRIESRIFVIRGQKVLLSDDLALLYGVPVGQLNQAVKRNAFRFPPDFMFQLSTREFENLKSQIVISSGQPSWGGARRGRPYAFTEQGVAMLSAVLRSPTAVAVSIEIMRAFARLRMLIASNEGLARKLHELERKLSDHDEQFAAVFAAIRELIAESDEPAKPRIGFDSESKS